MQTTTFFGYQSHDVFSLENMNSADCKAEFRVEKADLPHLADALHQGFRTGAANSGGIFPVIDLKANKINIEIIYSSEYVYLWTLGFQFSPRCNLKSSEMHVNIKLKSHTTTTADHLFSSFSTTFKNEVFICCCWRIIAFIICCWLSFLLFHTKLRLSNLAVGRWFLSQKVDLGILESEFPSDCRLSLPKLVHERDFFLCWKNISC